MKSIKISLSWLVDFCICLIFFSPQYISKIPVLDTFVYYMKICLILLFIFRLVKETQFSNVLVITTAIFLLVFIGTLYYNDSYMLAIGRYVSIIGILMFIELRKEKLWRLMSSIFSAGELLVYGNLVTMFIAPNGLYVGSNGALYWIIGQKQDFGTVYVVLLMISLLFFAEGMMKWRSIALWVAMIISLIISFPLGLILYFLVTILGLGVIRIHRLHIKSMFLLSINLFAEIFVVILTLIYNQLTGLHVFLSTIQAGSITKADTILSRVRMWMDAINLIIKFPIIGYGYITNERYFAITQYSTYHPHFHNMLLDIAVSGGILGLVLFVFMNYIVFSRLDKSSTASRNIILVSVFAMNVLMLTECLYWPYAFFVYGLAYYIQKIDLGKRVSAGFRIG